MKRSLILNTSFAALIAYVSVAGSVASAQVSPYAGEERNETKSLSSKEVSALLTGQGAGFAKAAELHGYPGPAHVLELADQLALTPEQLHRSRQLMHEHKERARQLGAEVVAAERALDRLFGERLADAAAVSTAAELIGLWNARLRAEHLNTHLLQTTVLSPSQIQRYSELRGYAVSTHGEAPRPDAISHQHSKRH